MAIEVKVPVLPESIADATVSTWHKQPGDVVRRDENLVDIETDKVMLEVVAAEDGILQSILKPTGSTVKAQEVIGIIEAGAQKSTAAAAPSAAAEVTPATSATVASPHLTPAVKRAVEAHGVDPTQVQGTGKEGRLQKTDVEAFLNQKAAPHNTTQSKVEAPALIGERIEKRVPMSRLRKRIAERLINSQHTAAILTTFNEVDLKPVMDIRKKYQDDFQKKHGVKLGFMSFFIKAAVEALKRFPLVNASIDGDDIVYHGYFDIGVAVSTDRGLVVPIIRDADQLTLADLEKQVNDYGLKARQNQLALEDMQGGTFTVSNGGIFGSLLSTPIINPPQSAILGMHKIEERPVVVDGQIVIRPMMYLAMSYDHRIIDGKESVTFLRTIKEVLEDPNRLLLDL